MGSKPETNSIAEIVPNYNKDERRLLAFQESWADYSRSLRTGFRCRLKPGGINFRAESLGQISATFDLHRTEFQDGSDAALIDALRLACEENVPLPYWVADGILAALADLDADPAANLHSVFGMEGRYPTSQKRARKARSDWKTKQVLYMRASALMELEKVGKGDAIRKAIKDERLPIRFRTAFDWYNEMDERQQKHLRARSGIKLHKLHKLR